jgi:hypothetical protein
MRCSDPLALTLWVSYINGLYLCQSLSPIADNNPRGADEEILRVWSLDFPLCLLFFYVWFDFSAFLRHMLERSVQYSPARPN